MEKWEHLISSLKNLSQLELKKKAKEDFNSYHVYASSIQRLSNTLFFIAKEDTAKILVLFGSEEYFHLFRGADRTVNGKPVKVCPMTHNNCAQLRTLFKYLNPISRGDRRLSFGMGDRLGVATPGHVRAIRDHDVFPVLAQQSVRELNLTRRNFEGVLDDVCWAVFQEGYTKGFGADADHLKMEEEVDMGLRSGYSMITLDCSDYIDNRYFDMEEEQLLKSYEALPATEIKRIDKEYLTSGFKIDEKTSIVFTDNDLMRFVLVYTAALEFVSHIYHDLILKNPQRVDFEVSIDETTVPTSPEAHYFIASELKRRRVRVDNMAPRFCGEFQKGIDYLGNITDFEKELIIHSKIADLFGYRLSIHSGSDKFKVFPYIGKYTCLNVHVKTAGTSWLEAVRLIAEKNPVLYRRMHKFALENIEKAKKYYHISAKPERIPDIDTLVDEGLPELLQNEDSRQVLHISYGLLLQEKDKKRKYVFRDDIYGAIFAYEEEYYKNLINHIGKHLKALGVF